MGKKVRKAINRFDGGMATSSRAEFESNFDLISHFDIYSDPKKLSPLPSYQEIVNADEHGYNFRALGGNGTILYATGYTRTDWLDGWDYRVQLTPTTTDSTLYTFYVDLSNLDANFWGNVNADGSDIRVTSTTDPGILLPFYLQDFDGGSETGTLLFKSTSQSVYIYYGNSDASITGGYYGQPGVYSNYAVAYSFDNTTDEAVDDSGNGYDDPSNGTSMDYTPVAGYFGEALKNDSVNANDDNGVNLGSSFSWSFLYYHATSSSTFSISISNATRLSSLATNKLAYTYEKVGGSATTVNSTSSPLTPGAWHHIYVNVNGTTSGDVSVYVNGSAVAGLNGFAFNSSGGWDHTRTGDPSLDTTNDGILDHILASTSATDTTHISNIHTNYLNNGTFWTVGSQVLESSSTPTYSGVALYENTTLASGGWTMDLVLGEPVSDKDYFPVLGQVTNDGTGFLVSQSDDNGGFIYGAVVNTANQALGNPIFDPSNTLFSVMTDYLFLGDEAIDKIHYLGTGGEVSSFNGTTYVDGAYDPYSSIALSAYNNYLAVGGHRRGKSVVEFWDLAETDPVTFVNLGTGELRVIGTVGGNLFAGINGFIDDVTLSAGKPYLDIRHYTGGSTWESIYKFNCPANYIGLTEDWEKPVSQLKLDTNFGFLFYAKIPNDSTPSTFREGWWAVGRNEITGTYGVSLYLDTSSLGYVEMAHRLGDQYFFIHNKDGSVSRLAVDGAYSETSTLITNKLDDEPNTKKKLQNVEIKTESLPSGQAYTVSVSVDGGAYQTVMTHDTDNAVQKSATQLADDSPLPTGYEFQFKITTTGGSASLTELAVEYELYGV